MAVDGARLEDEVTTDSDFRFDEDDGSSRSLSFSLDFSLVRSRSRSRSRLRPSCDDVSEAFPVSLLHILMGGSVGARGQAGVRGEGDRKHMGLRFQKVRELGTETTKLRSVDLPARQGGLGMGCPRVIHPLVVVANRGRFVIGGCTVVSWVAEERRVAGPITGLAPIRSGIPGS